MNRIRKKHISVLLCLVLLVTMLPLSTLNAEARTDKTMEEYDELVSTYSINESIPKYEDYIASAPQIYYDKEQIILAADYVRYEEDDNEQGVISAVPITYDNYIGQEGVSVLTTENSLIEMEVNVEQSGIYYLVLNYYPIEGKNTQIQRSIFVDGEIPYEELATVEFDRIWVNSVTDSYVDENGIELISWERDNQGNDIKPDTLEQPEWISTYIYDSNRYISTPLSIYLDAGIHTITLKAVREPMLLHSLELTGYTETESYSEVKAALDAEGKEDSSGQVIRIEAENSVKTSSQMLYPRQDQTSPAVYPTSTKALLNNSLGGNSWKTAGQWVEWEFEVEESGYYNVMMYVRQNFVRGIEVCRKIYIDGEVPFDEFNEYGFSYSQRWREEVLEDEDGSAYSIYLEKGTHTIKMEAVLGDMAGIISQVQTCVQDLNEIYRQVICITGVSPDKYRDYQIEACLPNLKALLSNVQVDLQEALAKLELTAGTNSDKLTVLKTMNDQLDELIEDQERFSEVIGSYKINVRALGTWITQVLGQPLQIDRIYLYSSDCQPKVEGDNFFTRVGFEIQRLFYSFIIDYNQIGNVIEDEDKTVLTLWIGTGRDQANVIKSLIDKDFTSEYGININVQLVDMNTLLRATLAGEGPDIAIQVANTNGIAGAVMNTGNDTPVNYGLRNAVLDLSQFDDFKEISKRFYESALIGFSFNGATYALPETQTFPMMFYRKDILDEIGLEIPETWDDVKVAMTVLSKNQMEFGMLANEQTFAMILYQMGGEYYTEDGMASALDSDIAVDAFKDYCEYYTDYKLDKETSVEERFRTGECPIIIADYTTFNNLQVSAPDIKGLWEFTNVPGTEQKDGTILRTTGCSCLADMILKATEHPEECWEFLKWWTSAETQISYGREMESLMGASARVATANKEALASLSWTYKNYQTLISQLEQVKGIPQVPGGYYTWRNVNNAFYSVTVDAASISSGVNNATPREELMEQVLYINAEINYKREEFNLPIAE